MRQIEIMEYPSRNPICGFVVDDEISAAAVTLLMATFKENEAIK